jgi:hypothetical protein
LNSGIYSDTGSVHDRTPSSTRIPQRAVMNALVFDATG